MSEFVLVDLRSQREQVREYVSGWHVSEILAWMRKFGTVTESQKDDQKSIYVFESKTGPKDAFYFDDHDELVVMSSGWIT